MSNYPRPSITTIPLILSFSIPITLILTLIVTLIGWLYTQGVRVVFVEIYKSNNIGKCYQIRGSTIRLDI